MRAWLRQFLLAGWVVLAAWLACEWLVPGSVSAFVPFFAGVLIWTVLTLLLGPLLPPFRRSWFAVGGLAFPCLAVLSLAFVFSVRVGSTFVFALVSLVGLLVAAFVPAFFLPNEAES